MRLLVLMCATLSAACSGPATTVEFEVDHFQVPCVGEILQLCLLVREGENADWRRFFEPIEGWQHTWGESSRILVRQRSLFTSGDDRPVVYDLEEVLSTEPVEPGTLFSYPFRPEEEDEDNRAVIADGAGGGTLLDGRGFQCLDDVVCEDLDGALGSRASVFLTFAYDEPITAPLILRQVVISQ